ncbi:hypothetical protein F0Q45_09980 [Mycobacterium simiae]|uniref:Uncharacterized protein n=1 Tax=Mycobacterium simiae TaxID=1784 RepID=A0A5B1BSF9_MYCSI|nr:hypothetical protein [Mycobacterium simiae]KAA1250370.1 hypothetical protein F0Q45_09980 [Mycobacterium simiae]
MKTKRAARVSGTRRSSGRDRNTTANGRAKADAAARRTRSGKTAAPNREARTPNSGPQTSPLPRPVDRPARPKNTRQAKARAIARKAKAPKVVRPKLTERVAARLAAVDLRPQTLVSRVPFVVLVIGSLGVGLALTLWLSTDAAERSYELSHARNRTRMLQQQKESLERDVREAQSAPALAEAARKQGMIPTRDTAHLVQAPDGNWVVVGTPKPADGVPPPPLNNKLPEEGPPPPPKPPTVPPEVPVRVMPGPGDPPSPLRSGPQLLPRTPDGASTLGSDSNHLPGQLPGPPGPVPLPGQLQLPVPAQLPVPGSVPAEVPLPLSAGALPPAVAAAPGVALAPALPAAPTIPAAPVAPVPPGLGPVLQPTPAPTVNGEQFGPLTLTAPGAPR